MKRPANSGRKSSCHVLRSRMQVSILELPERGPHVIDLPGPDVWALFFCPATWPDHSKKRSAFR
nr:hypothetical protein [Pseudomonas syringae pv. actinidiae]